MKYRDIDFNRVYSPIYTETSYINLPIFDLVQNMKNMDLYTYV